MVWPTATTFLAVSAATSCSPLAIDRPVRLRHAVPSHCRMSCFDPTLGSRLSPPTAHTFLGPRASIPNSTLVPFSGLGLGTTFHRSPFQCSISVLGWLPPLGT